MTEQAPPILAIACASVAAVIAALCLMRCIRTDHRRARMVYRVVFAALGALLAPTLLAAGHGLLPMPFIAGVPVLAFNLTSITELQVFPLGLLAIGANLGGGRADLFTLPSLLVFMLLLFSPWSRARPRPAR